MSMLRKIEQRLETYFAAYMFELILMIVIFDLTDPNTYVSAKFWLVSFLISAIITSSAFAGKKDPNLEI